MNGKTRNFVVRAGWVVLNKTGQASLTGMGDKIAAALAALSKAA
jgi:hypothetical protein